ncbi:MAG: 5'-methylthioadenosine nucleosidase, partial [Tenericutes bacterium]
MGVLASGSSFVDDEEYMKKAKEELGATIFDMETAAIAQIADKNNIPLKVVKVVSDVIGKDTTKLEDINKRIENAGKLALTEIL